MKINFMLLEMTYLRYYMPLIVAANRKGCKSQVFYGNNDKYNNPSLYVDLLKKLSLQYNFDLYPLRDSLSSHPAPITFLVEGRGHPIISYPTKKITLTCTGDFAFCYDDYLPHMDHVIFPSKFIAEYYGKISPKNLYLGTPKFDVDLDEASILKKYTLPEDKKALVIFPNLRRSMCPNWHYQYPAELPDYMKHNIEFIYSLLRSHGFKIVVKTRGKHAVQNALHRGDFFFKDFSWFPHSTMELLKVCDLAINFDSAAIKECVMLNKPIVNFQTRPTVPIYRSRRDGRPYDFLYKYNYCVDITSNFFSWPSLTHAQLDIATEFFAKTIHTLLSESHKTNFEKSKINHLFTNERMVSGNILDAII
jgi:hypothetical protein